MRFSPLETEIRAFHESIAKSIGSSQKILDDELKKDMVYYFTIDVPTSKIVNHKGLEHFFDFTGEPDLFDTIFSNIISTSYFFYVNSAMSIYSILIQDRKFLSGIEDASYTIDYLVQNKHGKVMLVRQLTIALELDENNSLKTNLTRCMVLEHDYDGSILMDYTPKITLNFKRVEDLEIEIKSQIARSFFRKMKEIADEIKTPVKKSNDKKHLVFTFRELEFLKLSAKNQKASQIQKSMDVGDDRIKQYKKSIIRKMNNIFQWEANPIKKFEDLLEFMKKNGLFDIDPLAVLYPTGRLTPTSNVITFAVSDKS